MNVYYKIPLSIGVLLICVAWYSYTENGVILFSCAIFTIASLFIIWAYRIFNQVNPDGRIIEFLFNNDIKSHSESDRDYAFYASLVASSIFIGLGLMTYTEEKLGSIVWIVLGVVQLLATTSERLR